MKNEYKIKGDAVYITIKTSDGREYQALVSVCDLEQLQSFDYSWTLKEDTRDSIPRQYAHAHWTKPNGTKTKIMLHRFILGLTDSSQMVDHINHNCLDNRRSNLRIVNNTQNQYNKSIHSNNKSGTPGLSWDKQKRKWNAELFYKGHRVFWKTYTDKEQATRDLKIVRDVVTKVVMADTTPA